MIKNKEQLKSYMDMDKKALGKNYNRPRLFGDDIWKFEIILRKHEYYVNTNSNMFLRKLYGFLHLRYGLKLGFTIPCNVIEGGLRINHFGLIVVNEKARIGSWCDIHQGVNIGQNIASDSAPVIGSNVWIGPGAKIFGKIEIGDNTMVGANAVVCKSFPEGNCRIAGNPAYIISNEPNCYIRK